ncbi:arsenate reductase family protein [Croceitalea rosinachiae]|uniref:ArsC/Spx/MgsR family protein n=1 Tax=Croceitalea rosinachiae TaxID=3075596 RepID=A0ABU3A9G3_9FLAO|nr:ArsC/Spx/MgsR family protein [Croceitalea sp. F388]MDT0606528.1 ArsC/Spx/MgsR family protein [Croceitalea sp. F388]
MKKIYHLETCKTCQKILKELEPFDGIELREIKSKGVTPSELEEMRALTDNYEDLFSRRAMLFRQRGLNNQELGEDDYKDLILEHYTFLKRPVVVVDDQIFIGNAKKQVEAAKTALHG